MPVINLSLSKLKEYAQNRASEAQILETLPYLGLDIEGTAGDTVSVEYSPNRPDYSSEVGIARSLLGMLGIRTGLPLYNFPRSTFEIEVPGKENPIFKVRPHIFGLVCDIAVDEALIKQLIAMQEDLHNGLGRKRSLLAIGIHNAEVITERIRYYATTDPTFSFVPLGSSRKMTIEEVLATTDQGIKYGGLVKPLGAFPILEDSAGHLLSMPPIINGELTRLKDGISRLFIDVTATDARAGDTATAIIASMLSDRGGRVLSVDVKSGGRLIRTTPDMTPQEMGFDLGLVNREIGFSLSIEQASQYLEKCRLSLGGEGGELVAKIPRYRSDIVHPVDLAEEVALGYGIQRIEPLETASALAGSFNRKLKRIDRMIEILVGLELTEVWNLSLVNSEQVSSTRAGSPLKVDNPKSQSFEFLRQDLTSSLLAVLGGTTDQEYPQKIFELAPVFQRSSDLQRHYTGVLEEQHAAALIASKDANYTMAHSLLDSFLRPLEVPHEHRVLLRPLVKKSAENRYFLEGRSAEVILAKEKDGENRIGMIGEIMPSAIDRYGLQVPIAGFELNIEPLLG